MNPPNLSSLPRRFESVTVLGGGGYVGAVLVPLLLQEGYRVRVFDLFLYGQDVLASVSGHPNLELRTGDVRDEEAVRSAVRDCDAVIHLACISNDPSVELDPELSESVNWRSFEPTVRASKDAGVRRFLFASSGSVYGVSDSPQVTEEHPLVPVSLYNRFKAMCEPVVLAARSGAFVPVVVRPSTLCGYSPRQRLDLTVNILTNHAYHAKKITVFGGAQMRPNLHLKDMVELYSLLLRAPDELVAGQIFNAGHQNHSVAETAELVRAVVVADAPEVGEVPIVTTPSDDIRSYRLNADKIQRILGFVPRRSIQDGARDLLAAFRAGLLPEAMSSDRYSNIKRMKAMALR